MFATGGHDGLVRVWTKTSDLPTTDTPMMTQPSSPGELILNRSESPIPEQELYAALASSAALRKPDNPLNGTPISSDLSVATPTKEQRSVVFVTSPVPEEFFDAEQDPH